MLPGSARDVELDDRFTLASFRFVFGYPDLESVPWSSTALAGPRIRSWGEGTIKLW
jgi:hypothetical protein